MIPFLGIDLNKDDDINENEEIIAEEENTPDIGAEICLEDLTGKLLLEK